MLHKQGLDEIVCRKLHLTQSRRFVGMGQHCRCAGKSGTRSRSGHGGQVRRSGRFWYKSLSEALIHAGIKTRTKGQDPLPDSEEMEKTGVGILANMDAIPCAGGFGKRGTEGRSRR